jgi:hypothetical protein
LAREDTGGLASLSIVERERWRGGKYNRVTGMGRIGQKCSGVK